MKQYDCPPIPSIDEGAKAKGLSRRDLADRIGVSSTHLNNITKGTFPLTADLCDAIGRALGQPWRDKVADECRTQMVKFVSDACKTMDLYDLDLLRTMLQGVQQSARVRKYSTEDGPRGSFADDSPSWIGQAASHLNRIPEKDADSVVRLLEAIVELPDEKRAAKATLAAALIGT